MTGPLPADVIEKIIFRGGSARRPAKDGSAGRPGEDAGARFKAGDRVRARNIHPAGHTRLPRYARGREGVVERVHGVFVFPDTNAMGKGEQPQPLYSVRFEGRELWGGGAPARDALYLDLWDAYLEPA